ncbi:DNA cytosine methyltransferase [Bowmanella sp. JS7-9]|uniref:DNA (cytosine-5-)-methyltransferase n=1 Tax=Pseudobowmanella zhangzhouensis TaxID=1537679 RepID=A0ABW1XM94_9ALTE|nr:DNA cytosine methyltransferase [Bowmanella sp. JS7-9]TBX21912.1 modification methylase [Bowmanella sp. JS7-9]
MSIKINSYFSGAGLMDVGLMQAGCQIQTAFEIDKNACATYRANLGDHITQVDISQLLVTEQPDCDAMVFTYPCDKYATSADIHGTRTGDDLFLHALRHLALKRPKAYVVENVMGMRKFPVVMECLTKLPDYYIWCFAPVKAQWWLPQKRDRLIIFGTRTPFAPRPPVNTRPVSLAEIVEKDPQVSIPPSMFTRLNGGANYRDKPIISDPARGDIAPCAVAHYGKDKTTRLLADPRFKGGVRPYSVREYARLQGLPDSFSFPVAESHAYKQIGNGVPVPLGRWLGGELKRYCATA